MAALKRIALDMTLKKQDWALEGLIPYGYVTMVGALPGEGKTAVLVSLCWQLTRPTGSFLDRSLERAAVLYINTDAPTGDARSIRFFLDRAKYTYGDGDLERFQVFEPDDNTLDLLECYNEATNTSPAFEELKAEVDALKAKYGRVVVVIDSFMASFVIDPIKLTGVQVAMRLLRVLASSTGSAVVVIDHLPKPMMGEDAGKRGLIGSIGKPAQSRAIHILTRLNKDDAGGRHILRWDVQKNSFGKVPEPFGVELTFTQHGLTIREADLPETQTRENKAQQASRKIQSHLAEQRGEWLARKDILEWVRNEVGTGDTSAKKGLDAALEVLKGELETEVREKEAGKPVFYRLTAGGLVRDSVSENIPPSDLNLNPPLIPSGTVGSLGQGVLTQTPKPDLNKNVLTQWEEVVENGR